MRSRSRFVLIAGAVYAAVIAGVGLWPTHVDQNIDLTQWPVFRWMVGQFALTNDQGYIIVEFASNVLLFVPVALLACALWPKLRRFQVILLGFAVSSLIEILQGVVLPDRTPSSSDIIANTLGTAIGATIVVGWRYRPSAVNEPVSRRWSRRVRQVAGFSLIAALLLQADRSPVCVPIQLPRASQTFADIMQPASTDVVPAAEATTTFSAEPPPWWPANKPVRWDTPGAFTHSQTPAPYGTLGQATAANAPAPNPAVGAEYASSNSTLKNADVSFDLTGQQFAIRYLTKSESDAMVWLDGQPVAAKSIPGSDPGGKGIYNWIVISLPQPRTVHVRFAGPGVFTGVDSPSARPATITAGTAPFTLGVVGDSYYEPSLAPRSNATSAAPELSTLTGFRIWNMAQGGTGYLNDGSGFDATGRAGYPGRYSTPFGSDVRLAELEKAPIDAMLVNGAINDGPPWTARQHRAALEKFLQAVERDRPDLPIVLVGIEPVSILRAPDEPLTHFTDLSNNFACMVGRHPGVVGFIDPYGENWLTGTGTTKTPQGDGNQDRYISADGVHPNGAGQVYYQSRVAAELAELSTTPVAGASKVTAR